jgi:hypothetical protein
MKGTRQPEGTKVNSLKPGDYILNSNKNFVGIRLPSGKFGQIDSKWTITVENDGSLTISPAIFDSSDGSYNILERGVWRQE